VRLPTQGAYNAPEIAARREKPITKPLALHHLPRIQEVLGQVPAGLLTDIDGTIAPIAPTPDEAQVSPLCRGALRTLASRLALVAAISGRDVLRARELVAIDDVVYVGNHGLERWQDGRREVAEEAKGYAAAIRQLVEELRHRLNVPGIVLEGKGVTASVHYRLTAEPREARDAIFRCLNDIPEARGLLLTEGRLVVEVRPPVGVDKGTSLERLVTENGLKGVVFMGDDVTDVAAFRALHSLSSQGRCLGLALGVLGPDTPSEVEQEADLLLRGVPEVEELLQRIVGTRPDAPAAGR